ncbi:MAG: KamA family radical SAM protein [Bacteroidia bacterium]|nr:KamA family radical SAM protein [Bacteroidia bacterium]
MLKEANDETLSFVINELPEDEEPPSLHSSSSEVRNDSLIKNGSQINQSEDDLISSSAQSASFMVSHFPGTRPEEWNDWKWQLRNSITKFNELSEFMHLSEHELNASLNNDYALPLRITPYYLSLLSVNNPDQALRRSVVPTFDELIFSEGEASDPLMEEHDSPVPCIVHRYRDRVLFLVTGFCSTYCRYCTRSHMVAKEEKSKTGTESWMKGIEYIREHTEIRDVLISGGDALTLSDNRLEFLLSRLRSIPHLEFIRIGSKVPVVMPQRITKTLAGILKNYHPLWMSIHFTHPDELTPEVAQACGRLADAGMPLGSQTVLLKGINDDVDTMKRLMHGLLKIRVRPYYLYQCDPILGSKHFRTPVEKGLEIISGLRGHTTGYAVPTYVIDAPGGGGKIPLLPENYAGRDGNFVLLRNYENKIFRYPDM